MNDIKDPIDSEDAPKRAWSAPLVEELSVVATEAAYVPGGGSDLGIYTT